MSLINFKNYLLYGSSVILILLGIFLIISTFKQNASILKKNYSSNDNLSKNRIILTKILYFIFIR